METDKKLITFVFTYKYADPTTKMNLTFGPDAIFFSLL